MAMLSSMLAGMTSQDMGPVSPITGTDIFMSSVVQAPEPSMPLPPSPPLRTSSTPTPTITSAIQTSLPVYSTHLFTTSTLSPTGHGPGADALSTLTPALAPYTTSQEDNTFTSLSFAQTLPTVSSSTSSDSAVIIGSSVGTTVLLCFIAMITLLCLRLRRRHFDTHAHLDPFDHPRPTVSPVNRKYMSEVLGGQRGYDRGENHTRSESSDSVTVVGTGDVGSLSEIADMSSGQRTSAATYSSSVTDIRHEEDHSVISRRERSRELGKFYPAEFSGATQPREREQESYENRARGTGDGDKI